MNSSSDSKLLELLADGNHLAYAALINKYWEPMYRHICAKIKNSDDAKDLVQDIFLGFWKNRTKIILGANESLAPYLYKSAKYSVINHFSRPGIAISDEKALLKALEAPSETKTDDIVLVDELKKLLDDEINQLPERLQLPYRLSREQDLPIKEIAVKLSLSEQTVKNNISSALTLIRFKLAKYNAQGTFTLLFALAVMLYTKLLIKG